MRATAAGGDNVIDLMAALKKSLEKTDDGKKSASGAREIRREEIVNLVVVSQEEVRLMARLGRQLADYVAKRDFSRTAEPRGHGRGQALLSDRRFVVQKHDATRLHYDFRLEWDGVLLSWAVTRGPSADPRRSGWPCAPRTIRSTTAISKARSRRTSMAAAR